MRSNRSITFTLPIILAISSGLFHCTKKKSDDSDTSTATTGTLRISLVAAGTTSASSSLALTPVTFDQFKNKTIASSAPDKMTLTVKEMNLYNSKTQATTPIFKDTSGKEISISGSSVDLSELFTKIECVKADGTIVEVPDGKSCKCGLNANGELIDQIDGTDASGAAAKVCPNIAAGDIPPVGVMEVSQQGEFDTLQVTFANKGTATGCVSGSFQPTPNSTVTDATYCTKSGLDLDSSSSMTKADYPGSGPTASTIYWSKSGKTGGDNVTKNYPIGETITIGNTDSTPTLTLVIDKGRLLRFYDGTSSTGPNPDAPSDKAYFFTSVFEDSTYVFVGRVGGIKGYRFAAKVQEDNDLSVTVPDVGNRECSESNGDTCRYVNGWLTVIEDINQKPYAVSLMPDDDNAFTVAKGTNADTTTSGGINSSLITVNSDSTWSIQYNLINSGKTEGLTGNFYKLNPTLGVNESQTIEMTASQTDTSLNAFKAWGTVTLLRAL